MQYTAPIWIYLVSRVKGYPFYWRRALPLGILAAGVVVSMFSRAQNVTMAGNLIALSTGVWFALLTLLNKDIGNENPIGVVSLENLFMAAVILPVFCRGSLGELLTLDTTSWILLATLGIGQFGLGYVLYTIGLGYTSSAHASMISPVEMILSPVWVALAIGELPDLVGLIGFIVIIAGIALEVVFTPKYSEAARIESAAPAVEN
jgi:drug/metabolite transporter (DMT)-like permease